MKTERKAKRQACAAAGRRPSWPGAVEFEVGVVAAIGFWCSKGRHADALPAREFAEA